MADWFRVFNPESIVTWSEFVDSVPPTYKVWGTMKKVAPLGSQTSESLQFVLERIWHHFRGRIPKIMNVVLYFYDPTKHTLPKNRTRFRFVPMPYDSAECGYVVLSERSAQGVR